METTDVAGQDGTPRLPAAHSWGKHSGSPAEIRFLRGIGIDAVGMSTAAEVVVAQHSGMRTLGLSHISNVAVGEVPAAQAQPEEADSIEDPHHAVLAAGQLAIPRLVALIRGGLDRLDGIL